MSPIGVNFGALIALIYSVGVTRAWPLLSYVNTTQGEHADSGGGTFDFDDTNVGHLRQEKGELERKDGESTAIYFPRC